MQLNRRKFSKEFKLQVINETAQIYYQVIPDFRNGTPNNLRIGIIWSLPIKPCDDRCRGGYKTLPYISIGTPIWKHLYIVLAG